MRACVVPLPRLRDRWVAGVVAVVDLTAAALLLAYPPARAWIALIGAVVAAGNLLLIQAHRRSR